MATERRRGVGGEAVRSGAMRKGKSYQTKAPLVRRTPEGDRPTVAVVIGAELRQSQCPTTDELLQGGTAGLR
jgi:hypothetical protein